MEQLLHVVERYEILCSRHSRHAVLVHTGNRKTIFIVERSRQQKTRSRRRRRQMSSTHAHSESDAVGLSDAVCRRSPLVNAAIGLLALVAPPGELK